MNLKIIIGLTLSSVILVSCEITIPQSPDENELLDGPTQGLSTAENHQFLQGDIAFNNEVFTTETGLGPHFVAASCGSCHAGDGKGHPFTTLTRFGQTQPNQSPDLNIGGPQLQNKAILGYEPEKLPSGIPCMRFTPPAVTGLGFLEALTDSQILTHADPMDVNGDGISGVPNYITPPSFFVSNWKHTPLNGKIIGRFGKKASAVDLLHQTVGAYNQDMGITSTFEPLDPLTQLSTDPEVSDQTVRNIVFYLQTLKAPIPRNEDDSEVLFGKEIFNQINCSGCHTTEWTTPDSHIDALSNKMIHPYTDLLLHDMGEGLDDGATEGSAETYEWRTPPLWGLGLSPNSQGGSYFLLHDGRARSIEEAILLHGGESETSKNNFTQLSQTEKEALLQFLESL